MTSAAHHKCIAAAKQFVLDDCRIMGNSNAPYDGGGIYTCPPLEQHFGLPFSIVERKNFAMNSE